MSGLTPPQPIANFPDCFLRNDDLIRPKPRRLVDMRRSAIGTGTDHLLTSSNSSPVHLDPANTFSNIASSPSAKSGLSGPYKPLPPRPSSTSSSLLSSSGPMKSFGSSPQQRAFSNLGQPNHQLLQSNNGSANALFTSTPLAYSQRSVPNLAAFGKQPPPPSNRLFLSPQPNDGINLANVGGSRENLLNMNNSGCGSDNGYYAELILPKEAPVRNNFSSPPPSKSILPTLPTFAKELQQHQQPSPPKNRMRMEWKSVDNLQQSNHYYSAHNIDIQESNNLSNMNFYSNSPTSGITTHHAQESRYMSTGMSNSNTSAFGLQPSNKFGGNPKLTSCGGGSSEKIFDVGMTRELRDMHNNHNNNKSDLNLDTIPGGNTSNLIALTNATRNLNGPPNSHDKNHVNSKKLFPESTFRPSPTADYDRIKSPVTPEPPANNAQLNGFHSSSSCKNLLNAIDNHSGGSDSPSGNNTTKSSPNISTSKTRNLVGASPTHNNTPETTSIPAHDLSNQEDLKVPLNAKSPNDGSLGRSSTSDGDFANIGSAGKIISSRALAEKKSSSRHSAPSSKLKSRRRNILQHLSMEEMRMFTGGNNNINGPAGPNIIGNDRDGIQTGSNTNTGGSSSSDGSSGHASMSDSQASGSPPAPAEYARITPNGSVLSPASYKSVLKSVPEDEVNSSGSNQNDSSRNMTAATANSSINSDRTDRNSSGKKGSSRSRHRNTDSGGSGIHHVGGGGSGLEDIKAAIEQLTLRTYAGNPPRNDHHSSYSTSTYSSMSGSECDRHRRPHLIRHSSLETINTQVTSADEFVWVDSHNRLVELQSFPWSNHDILKVIERSSRLKDNLERISMEVVPRISYLLQRALVRISRETQRLAKAYGFCTKQEVTSAFKIVLSPGLADSCIKAALRAAAMYSVSTSDPLHRESKSARAGLHLHVGRFQRWMCEVRLGRFVHEFAAIHLTAGLENLIEEILGQALSFIATSSTTTGGCGENSLTAPPHPVLTAALLEQAIANNGDMWGLLQPYAHLNAGRTASGALTLPRWASIASVDSSGSSNTTIGASHHDDHSLRHQHNKNLEQSLLTTCVGSLGELGDILSRVSYYHHKQIPSSSGSTSNNSSSTSNSNAKAMAPSWSPSAIHTLFYFMRCSQLETADEHINLAASTATLGSETLQRQHHQQNKIPVQELVYERPFVVLPPLIEWVRVSTAHAEHRHSWLIDKDDVMQAARILLPGIDCPIRLIGSDEFSWPRRPIDEFECNRRLKIDLAFKMLTSGRSDLVAQALLLMPPSKANTFSENGLSPLILASIRGEENMVRVLLDAGADADVETPSNGTNFPQANTETSYWTALTFASLTGCVNICKVLLEHGANVEGGAKLSEDKTTQTPLQLAAASGNLDIVSMLLSYGANPFQSTLVRDSLCYTGSAQRGSFSAISVAASHGQRAILHKLLSHPLNSAPAAKEVLSLEEILAEGVQPTTPARNVIHQNSAPPNKTCDEPKLLTKSQVKVLQEAMYQSTENGHLEITLDLRNLGVPWTLHCWINALSTAQELRCEPVVDQLLQDLLQILPHEDFSQGHFVDDCLPLLFGIFRNSKNEGTTLLLADIFQTCYGRDPIKDIRDTTILSGTRIDPKYVNNPELSDVQFRVEGRVFYAHKIVLVTSSPRFKSMLKSAPETNPPILQINDIRYHIFQMVMEYLYNGNCDTICNIETEDVLELMAASNFFQLDGLLRFCEAKCSMLVSIESVVSLYIHAKVYNAVQLLEYCQGFLLRNMVALLTYDDSVRRLIFGKKLHNHDVLAGLLLTLQARLKGKKSTS